MTKIIFDYDHLNKEIIPNINNIIDKLTELKQFIDKMYIPSDFKYNSNYDNISNTLEDNLKKYNDLLEKIEKINTDLTNKIIDNNIITDNISI